MFFSRTKHQNLYFVILIEKNSLLKIKKTLILYVLFFTKTYKQQKEV